MSDKIQRPPNLTEAKFRCTEATDALKDIDAALSASGVFGTSLVVSEARLNVGRALFQCSELKANLDLLCTRLGSALAGGIA
jgi:hypothetical protein